MRFRAPLVAIAAAMLIAVLPGCDEDSAAQPPRAPERASVPGGEPVLGVAEANSWRRVPPLATAYETARLIERFGADSQRFVVDWSVVEPQPPDQIHHYDFSAFDEMYRAAVDRGIRPLLIVLSAPVWASDPGTTRSGAAHNPPAASRLADWASFVGAVASRYPRSLGIEIWNEPNLKVFWGGDSPLVRPDPARYATLLRTAYVAVKAANPRLLVLGGALSPGAESPAGDLPAADFARAIYGAGAAEYMDGLSLHPYPGPGGVSQALARIDAVRRARDEAGADTPLWLTEIGVTTTGPFAVSEGEQASELAAICRAASRQPDVDGIYIHNLIERPGPVSSPEPGFGLAQRAPDGGLRPKPAFDALRRAFSRRGGC